MIPVLIRARALPDQTPIIRGGQISQT